MAIDNCFYPTVSGKQKDSTVLLEKKLRIVKTEKIKMKSHFSKQGVLIIKLMMISVFFCFSSCDKNDMNNNETETNENYYVNYIIKGNGAYGRFSNWTATTPQGIYTNSGYQVRSWNQTYCPVNKGFKCEVKINDYISGAPTIEIHVSKNKEPFALKVSETGGSASYTINF